MRRVYLAVLVIAVVAVVVVYFYRSPNVFDRSKACRLVVPCGGRLTRVDGSSVYWTLNLFDIHTQYVPICGRVVSIERVDGEYHSVLGVDADSENSRVVTTIMDLNGELVILEQLAGMITRKIDNYLNPGQWVWSGEKLGRIHFGSRVILHLPTSYDISRVRRLVGERLGPGSILI